jgi:hypothetical protein
MRFLSMIIAMICLFSVNSFASTSVASKVIYDRGSVGTTAAAATEVANKATWGWTLCHDGVGSGGTYLAFSEDTDPDTDGTRLVPGACFDCINCGFGTLSRLRVKGQAAATTYSIIQRVSR